MVKYLLTAGILLFAIITANADFADFIKKDSGIPIKEHPSLFFSAEDIPRLRKKAGSKYFKAYIADLLANADIMLKQHPGSKVFPFSENPNFQTITETLVMAYVITGKAEYARRAIDLTTAFVNAHYEKIPVTESGKFTGWIRGNSTTFILIPISFVYDTLYYRMSEKERFDIRKGLAYFCQLTYNMICTAEYGMSFYKNYTAGETGALGIACMVLRHETDLPVDIWLDRALRYTVSWQNVAVRPDGMFPEGTTYFAYTAGNQMLFLYALSLEQNIKYFDKTNLKNTLKWMILSMLPWKSETDNFSDGRYIPSWRNIPFIFQNEYPETGNFLVRQLFGACPRYKSDPFALIFGNDPGRNKFNPAKELGFSHLFQYGGMAAFRSGWSVQDVLMYVYATKYDYSAHSQADRGHFNLYGYGHKWLIDSGYGNDAKIINSATPSEAHSLILIDGKGEAFDPTMRQSGTFADIDRYISDEKLSYVRVDQKDAYDFYNRYTWRSRKIYNPVQKAFRNVIFINKAETPPYSLVYDDIDKDGKTHDYTYLLQLARGKKITSDGKHKLSLKPYEFSGKAISNMEAGKYGEFKKPGYRIFRYLAGYMKFEINVPEAGKYIMWTFARNHPGFISEVGINVNGKVYGRSQIAFSLDYDWFPLTANKKKMHKPYVFELKKGKNIIELRGVTQGYELLKGIFVKYAHGAVEMPVGYKPENVKGISFDASNLVGKNDVELVNVSQQTCSECRIKALWPQNGGITIDSYQPSRDALHKRMNFKVKSIEPNFLFMLYPKKTDMPLPESNSRKIPNGIKTIIKWNNCQDIILINTGKSIFEDRETGIKTDGRLTFCRLNNSGRLIRIFSDGCTLLEKSGDKLYTGKGSTIIYENGKLKKAKYLIDRSSKQRKVPEMINWKKAAAVTAVAAAVATSSNAAKVKTYARIDINAEAGQIRLTPDKGKTSKGVALSQAAWRKEKKIYYLSSRIYFYKDVWRRIKIAFTPDKDGKAKLLLLGAWLPKPQQKNLVWFKYVNIKVDGKPVSLDDKSWKLSGGAGIINSKGPDGKETKCLKAKCYSTGDYIIDVKKDQTVIIEFDVKIAE